MAADRSESRCALDMLAYDAIFRHEVFVAQQQFLIH